MSTHLSPRIAKRRTPKSTVLTAVALLAATVTGFATQASAQTLSSALQTSVDTNPIDAARWKARMLVSCTADGQASLFSSLSAQADWRGYEDRDLVLVDVRKDGVDAWSMANASAAPQKQNQSAYAIDYRYLAQCIDSEPSLSLIGKDGTIKERWTNLPSNSEIFTLIDSMPMRQMELRGQN